MEIFSPFYNISNNSKYNHKNLNFVDYLKFVENEVVREPIFKIEFINKTDETPYASIEDKIINSSGSLNITLQNGVRRTCNFTLVNKNNEYTKLFSNLTIGSKFRLSLGYIIYGTPYYIQQGVFIFDSPTLESLTTSKTISISGTDKWSMLNGTNGGILETTYMVEQGTTLQSVVTNTLALDIVYDPIKPNIDESVANYKIPYNIIKESGATIADILLEIAETANSDIYYDENGICNIKPFEYDETKGVLYHYKQDDINNLGMSRLFQYDMLYNATFVVADNLQNEAVPIYAEALNEDLSDPNSVPNLGYKKYYPITEHVKGITTQSLADERCRYELKKVSSKQSTLSISSRPLYHLQENQVILIDDEHLDAKSERFLINGYNIPISTDGSMTIELTKTMEYI